MKLEMESVLRGFNAILTICGMDYTFVFREGDDIDKFGREVEKAVKAELKKEGFPVGCLKWELNQLGLAFSEIAFAWIRAERLEKAVLWDVESDGRTL